MYTELTDLSIHWYSMILVTFYYDPVSSCLRVWCVRIKISDQTLDVIPLVWGYLNISSSETKTSTRRKRIPISTVNESRCGFSRTKVQYKIRLWNHVKVGSQKDHSGPLQLLIPIYSLLNRKKKSNRVSPIITSGFLGSLQLGMNHSTNRN